MGAVHDAEQPLRQRLRGTVLALEPNRSHTVCPGEANVRQVRPCVGRYLECEVREGRIRLLLVVGLLAARATVRLRLRVGSGGVRLGARWAATLFQRTRHSSGTTSKPISSSAIDRSVFCSQQYPPRRSSTSFFSTSPLAIEIVLPRTTSMFSKAIARE